MIDADRSSLPKLPVERIAELRAQQDRAWRAGARVSAEALLAEAPEVAADPEAKLIVVLGEYLLRKESGEAVAAAEFVARFPDLAGRLSEQIAFQEALDAPATADGVHSTLPLRFDAAAPLEATTLPGVELLRELGRGGVGVVFLGRQMRLGRSVAVKTLSAGLLATKESRLRFQFEAEVLARLNHPNIVQVYEVAEHQGMPYLLMEYMAGGSLRDAVRDGPLLPRQAAEIVETLARAMHRVHLEGIVHRDLKPANVLRDERGAVKIADFGLAKGLTADSKDLTQTGVMCGTPAYMAPEQTGAAGTAIGPLTDVYALGAILFELLAAHPPFQGASPLEIVQKAATQEAPSLRTVAPADLAIVAAKCLEKTPADRYASAAALADDLRNWLDDKPIAARPTSVWEKTRRWRRRNPLAANLLAILAVSIPLSLAVVTVLYFNAERNRARADHRSHLMQTLMHEMLVDLSDVLAKTQDSEQVRMLLSERAVGFYESMANEPDAQTRRFRRDEAHAHRSLAECLRTVKKYAEAKERFERGDRLLAQLHAEDPTDDRLIADWAWHEVEFARHLEAMEDFDGAERLVRKSIELYALATMTLPEREGLAYAYGKLGELTARDPRRSRETKVALDAAVAEQRKLVRDYPASVRIAAILGSFLVKRADLTLAAESPAEAERACKEAETLTERRPQETEERRRLETREEMWRLRAKLARRAGDRPRLLAQLRQAAAAAEELARSFPQTPWFRVTLIDNLAELSLELQRSSQTEDRAAAKTTLARAQAEAAQLEREIADYVFLRPVLKKLRELDAGMKP